MNVLSLFDGIIMYISSTRSRATLTTDKASVLLASSGCGDVPMIVTDDVFRRITPVEASRLQTIPEWYKWGCSNSQAYKMLGNGWTVEVIKHIFSFL